MTEDVTNTGSIPHEDEVETTARRELGKVCNEFAQLALSARHLVPNHSIVTTKLVAFVSRDVFRRQPLSSQECLSEINETPIICRARIAARLLKELKAAIKYLRRLIAQFFYHCETFVGPVFRVVTHFPRRILGEEKVSDRRFDYIVNVRWWHNCHLGHLSESPGYGKALSIQSRSCAY